MSHFRPISSMQTIFSFICRSVCVFILYFFLVFSMREKKIGIFLRSASQSLVLRMRFIRVQYNTPMPLHFTFKHLDITSDHIHFYMLLCVCYFFLLLFIYFFSRIHSVFFCVQDHRICMCFILAQYSTSMPLHFTFKHLHITSESTTRRLMDVKNVYTFKQSVSLGEENSL